jgi:hypothetical protein
MEFKMIDRHTLRSCFLDMLEDPVYTIRGWRGDEHFIPKRGFVPRLAGWCGMHLKSYWLELTGYAFSTCGGGLWSEFEEPIAEGVSGVYVVPHFLGSQKLLEVGRARVVRAKLLREHANTDMAQACGISSLI